MDVGSAGAGRRAWWHGAGRQRQGQRFGHRTPCDARRRRQHVRPHLQDELVVYLRGGAGC